MEDLWSIHWDIQQHIPSRGRGHLSSWTAKFLRLIGGNTKYKTIKYKLYNKSRKKENSFLSFGPLGPVLWEPRLGPGLDLAVDVTAGGLRCCWEFDFAGAPEAGGARCFPFPLVWIPTIVWFMLAVGMGRSGTRILSTRRRSLRVTPFFKRVRAWTHSALNLSTSDFLIADTTFYVFR